MTSANGTIPAGSVSLPITEEKGLKNYELISLDVGKCPDKSSKIVVSIFTEDIRVTKKSIINQILGN